MSLRIDDDDRGGRARSRSRDRRSRRDAGRDAAASYADTREPGYAYPEDDLDDTYRAGRRQGAGGLPYPADGGMGGLLPGAGQPLYGYDDERLRRRTASPSRSGPLRSSVTVLDPQLPGAFPEDRRSWRQDDQERRPPLSPVRDSERRSDVQHDILRFLPQKYSRRYIEALDAQGRDAMADRRRKKERDEDDLAYGPAPPFPRSPKLESVHAYRSRYAFGSRTDDQRTSTHGRDDEDQRRWSAFPEDGYAAKRPHQASYRDNLSPSPGGAHVLTAERPARDRDRRRDKSPGPSILAVDTGRRDRDPSTDGQRSARDASPRPPTVRMSSLTVDTGRHSNMSLAGAPPSPLLESYHGTYQESSPMPSPLLLASQGPGGDARVLEALSPLASDAEGEVKRFNRRARFHDADDIIDRISQALRGDRAPDTQPLVEILPSLSHDQVMELRADYKRQVKTGAERKGVNVAKHIRMCLKDEDPSLMKACYAVALGRWESEAYWANFWYQGDKTRRELLIEALMGRSNAEIRRIKDAFTDKKYDNSLIMCMKTELKEDKFKKAVLAVLDERRMDDVDAYGRRFPLDYDLVDADVDDLRRAVKADKGGESAMVGIVFKRSDAHLHAVLKEYEDRYHANFAREALKKSGNLVGELLAHILNGVINRPVRDALLLHHVLSASRKDDLRRELLISRLVRFHWDPAHMQAVKRAFGDRYGRDLQDAVRDATHGSWGRFCCELCIARMPNDVRRVERVDRIERPL